MSTETHSTPFGGPFKTSDGAHHVNLRDSAGGESEPVTIGVNWEIADLTDSRSSVTEGTNKLTIPTGAVVLDVEFFDDGSATADKLYLVFNAADNGEADAKLGEAGNRAVVTIGSRKRFRFTPADPCVRVDLKTDAGTESGDTLIIVEAALA